MRDVFVANSWLFSFSSPPTPPPPSQQELTVSGGAGRNLILPEHHPHSFRGGKQAAWLDCGWKKGTLLNCSTVLGHHRNYYCYLFIFFMFEAEFMGRKERGSLRSQPIFQLSDVWGGSERSGRRLSSALTRSAVLFRCANNR